MGTPSTADLLRAAQSGSTAQLHMEASQFGTSTAPFAPPGKCPYAPCCHITT